LKNNKDKFKITIKNKSKNIDCESFTIFIYEKSEMENILKRSLRKEGIL